jgi:hypothetical protein
VVGRVGRVRSCVLDFFHVWVVETQCSFDRFSLAAAVLGMMTFAQCRLHRKAVLEVDVFVVCVHVTSHASHEAGGMLSKIGGPGPTSGSLVRRDCPEAMGGPELQEAQL